MAEREFPQKDFQGHTHGDMVHGHQHIHITHHDKGGEHEQIEHLVARHEHQHNHAALEHTHTPHENFDREHQHEAHVHDHEHPAES